MSGIEVFEVKHELGAKNKTKHYTQSLFWSLRVGRRSSLRQSLLRVFAGVVAHTLVVALVPKVSLCGVRSWGIGPSLDTAALLWDREREISELWDLFPSHSCFYYTYLVLLHLPYIAFLSVFSSYFFILIHLSIFFSCFWILSRSCTNIHFLFQETCNILPILVPYLFPMFLFQFFIYGTI